MRRVRWGTLSTSARIAASAFGLHAALLIVDLVFFQGAFTGHSRWSFWPALRVITFGLFALSIVLEDPRTWLLGFIALIGFFLSDLFKVGPLLRGPESTSGLVALTVTLLLTLVVAVIASFWASLKAARPQPAA